jgi:hypothetical protein
MLYAQPLSETMEVRRQFFHTAKRDKFSLP